jgi:uncharacterized protein
MSLRRRAKAKSVGLPVIVNDTGGVLSDDMRRMIEAVRLAYVATVNPDGGPNLSPKGTLAVWNDGSLIFAHLHSAQTVANIESGRDQVEVNVVDPIARRGYRFRGRAVVHRAGGAFDDGCRFYQDRSGLDRSRIAAIVVIEIEAAAPVLSPAYDDGTAQAVIEERSLVMYGLRRAEEEQSLRHRPGSGPDGG